ncbi:MAG: glycoside hydrolase family 76 protein, partial [Kiloniellales bacterium]
LDAAGEAKLAAARAVLLHERETRIRPGRDDKVLADWNGLMIAALARAAPAFAAPDWLAAAERAFAFVIEQMSGAGGVLLHAWRRGEARHRATLDDYAFMGEAALALYEATGRNDYLERAEGWVTYLERQFWDQANGGYFFTDRAAEDLLLRSKTAFDSATPAGNGALVAVLARLHYLTGKAHYRERAEALLTAFSGDLERAVLPLATLLAGCELLDRALEIVILGRRGETATEDLLRQVHARSLPNAVLTVASDTGKLPAGHPAEGRERKSGKVTAYLCRAQSCSLPITAAKALGTALDG